jgi:EAL domain-containing protein (putative c-di-GMP-specific phosphodiesterase class I)
MFRAKALGTGRHMVFDSSMHDNALALLQMETELRRAVEEKAYPFGIEYQPIVSLGTGKLGGFEALLRWVHPERGVLSPSEFIPVAEETGLIVPLGLWMLREACSQMQAWNAEFPAETPLFVSVNLSGKQFGQPDIREQVRLTLRDTELDPRALWLEITESALMGDVKSAAEKLWSIKTLNVRLQVDDFGTGYSSLSYLSRFPLDGLKIDRSFMIQPGHRSQDAEIVRTIAELARNLGIEVMAEGVETAEQLQQLRELQCAYGQGFYFSKPLGSEAARELIAEAPSW